MMLKISLFLSIFIAAVANSSYACTCGGDATPRARFDRADFIFSGKVIEITDKVAKFRIESVYKGEIVKDMVLTRKGQETTCDVFFNKDQKYIVYANKVETRDDGAIMTDVCAGTQKYVKNSGDLSYLETPDTSPILGGLVHPKDKKAIQRSKQKAKTR